MKLPEHLAFSFVLAHLGPQQEFGAVGAGLVIAAGMLPDLDGLTVLGGWRWHRSYHRVIGHGLPLTIGGPLVLAFVGVWLLPAASFSLLWCWLQLALLAHLLTDIVFYRWPVQWLWPISSRGLGLGRVAWNDLAPTAILYGGTALLMVWPRFDIAAWTLFAFGGYLVWCAAQPLPRSPVGAWLTGAWASRSPRWFRWLTGDFVT